MTGKQSFLIILRIFFIVFSLQFVKDAFYKWDGYSYHMRFGDFLPDLSLAFILWTIIGVLIAVVLWISIYGFFRIIPKSLIPIRLEHIMTFFIFVVLPLFIKKIFFSHISLSNLIGLNRFVFLTIGGILVVLVIWFLRKYIEKILYGLNDRITPVVWLFTILFILALPFSVLKKDTSGTTHTSDKDNKAQTVYSDVKRPNIILVIMDALTARDMQVYGYELATTPFISEWAKDAIVFNKVYSPSNWTSASVMSLMSGQNVWTHKIWYLTAFNPVKDYKNNLPVLLKDDGYIVYGLVQNVHAHPETLGIQDAFFVKDNPFTFWKPSKWCFTRLGDLFLNRAITQDWIFRSSFIADKINSYHPDVYTTRVPPEMVYNRFLEYISQAQIKESQHPFFASLHVFPPHNPYLPPKPYMGFFGNSEKFNSDRKQWGGFNFHSEYNLERQKDIDILRKRYDEFILYSDKQFELFLSRLAGIIDMSNTIVILTSDHGESFSHGYLGHGGEHLYESLVHVPLIIKLPGMTSGKVIDIPVKQIDITSTILALARIPVPAWMEGRSLLPFIQGKSLEPQPIFSMQFRKNRALGHPITKGTVAVWDRDYKLIYYLEDKKRLLFDLKSDPDEQQDIYKEEPEIGQRLLKLIDDELSKANAKITQAKGSP